jgi:hypothetical protein
MGNLTEEDLVFLSQDSSLKDATGWQRNRPRCNVCHQWKYGDHKVDISMIPVSQRQNYLHRCTRALCTFFRDCPTAWKNVIFVFVFFFFSSLINLKGHMAATTMLKQYKRELESFKKQEKARTAAELARQKKQKKNSDVAAAKQSKNGK